jgi:hypothetical protein
MHTWSWHRVDRGTVAGCLVAVAAALVVFASARDYAGSWNDGSRLATVESLVDYHTLAIDRSIFVQVPPRTNPAAPGPYPADEPLLLQDGTRDKLLIRGHFYSDKSPVPALLMAVLYKGLQWGTGLTARERPDLFCYLMTVGTSGLAYVVAVWSLFALGGLVPLSLSVRVLLTASFSLATVALTYTRHVNNHILLLGIASALLLGFAKMARQSQMGPVSAGRVLGLGALAGLAYTVDLGAGPPLFVCALALVLFRGRGLRPMLIFLLGALPWLALHHTLNYGIGGTFRPANAVPEYVLWPGSAFIPENITGSWKHKSVAHFLLYALSMLFGKRGFFGHNLPLFLVLPGIVTQLRRRTPERPEILGGLAWAAGTWLLYAVASTNYSGVAASIRWFVPLLAPAYYLLALFLRERPTYRSDFLILSGWGLLMAALMWWKGPWMKRMVPFFWFIQGAALLSWLVYRVRQHRRVTGTPVLAEGKTGSSVGMH